MYNFSKTDLFNLITPKTKKILVALAFTASFYPTKMLAQCTLSCKENVKVALANDCLTQVAIDMIAPDSKTTCIGGDLKISILEQNGTPLMSSPYVGSVEIGKTLKVKILDQVSNQSCLGSIIVEDKLAPSIDCPKDITINTESTVCYAKYQIPNFNIKDNCTTANNITKKITINGMLEKDSIINLPTGKHELMVTAIDAFDNSSSCTYNVTVKDLTPPKVTCSASTTVLLDVKGKTELYAYIFDDSSRDNCEIDSFAVAKLEPNLGAFDSQISFNCFDVGKTILVNLRAWDSSDNYNDCVIQVEVSDKLSKKLCDSLKLTNIKDKKEKMIHKIYPNPTTGFLAIEFSSSIEESLYLEVFDTFSQKIFTQELQNSNNQNTIDLSWLPNAIYFYQIRNANLKVMDIGKLIKIGH